MLGLWFPWSPWHKFIQISLFAAIKSYFQYQCRIHHVSYITGLNVGGWFPILLFLLMLLLFTCPLVRGVCPNYEVVMFQPHTGTHPYLGSVANCYRAMLLSPDPLFTPAIQCPPGGDFRSFPFPLFLYERLAPTQDHSPTRASSVSVLAYRGLSLPKSESSTSPPSPPLPNLPDSLSHSLVSA